MTAASGPPFALTWEIGPGTLYMHIVGDLDHQSYGGLVHITRYHLQGHPELCHLRLNCARLTACDPMGLSALLQIRRLTGAASIRLHLDNRPMFLERVLNITGTHHYLTDPVDATPLDARRPGRPGAT